MIGLNILVITTKSWEMKIKNARAEVYIDLSKVQQKMCTDIIL
jgi:hypothetical protein